MLHRFAVRCCGGRRRRALLASLLGLAAITAASWVGWNAREQSVETQAVYHLALREREADRLDDGVHGLATHTVELGFDRRFSLYQHPPSAFRFADVPSSPDAVLRVAPILAPEASQTLTDGVVFEILCEDEAGDSRLVFQKAVPRPDPSELPAWGEQEVSLAGCSTPTTVVDLRTDCGPRAHCGDDWAYWGDPRVVYRRSVLRRPLRLVLLISIDTLRADRIELSDGARPTPHLQALARDGVVFEDTIAPSPWTIPSHVSLLTSTPPHVHGVNGDTMLSPELPTLAESFARAGWATAAFFDTPWFVRDDFRRGFAHFRGAPPAKNLDRRGVAITRERLLDWLTASTATSAFVFWHIMDVHGPYAARAPFAGRYRASVTASDGSAEVLASLATLGVHHYLELERFRSIEDLVAGYDEGVAAVDAAIGELFEVLKAVGWYDDALIVVTSDHGERFFEQGIQVGHGLFLSDADLAVPLLAKLPGNRHAGARVGGLTELIDVAPTILGLSGIPVPEPFEGRRLVDLDRPPARGVEGPIFGESSNTGAAFARTERFKYIGPWQLPREEVLGRHVFPRAGAEEILSRIDTGERLFDLAVDPEERRNLIRSAEGSRVAATISSELAEEQARAAQLRVSRRATRADPLGEGLRERLRALGYLDAGSEGSSEGDAEP